MRAIVQESRDGPRCCKGDVSLPKCGDNDILIRVECAPINPSDLTFCEGKHPLSWEKDFPVPLGLEGCGEVVSEG